MAIYDRGFVRKLSGQEYTEVRLVTAFAINLSQFYADLVGVQREKRGNQLSYDFTVLLSVETEKNCHIFPVSSL